MCPHGFGFILKHSFDSLASYCQIVSKLAHCYIFILFLKHGPVFTRKGKVWQNTVTIAAGKHPESAVSCLLCIPYILVLSLFGNGYDSCGFSN